MVKQSVFLKKINFCVSRIIVASALFLTVTLYFLVMQNYLKLPSFGISSLRAVAPSKQPISFVSVNTTEELKKLFNKYEYCLKGEPSKSSIKVPAIFLSTLPNDFAKNLTIPEKKELFMQVLLPLILEANNEIMQERIKLIALKEVIKNNGSILESQREWLENLAKKYRLKKFSYKKLNDLLVRVDEIPVAMALGQSIEETGWGRSRAARIGNATHGVTLVSGVKSYASLDTSVKAYMRNLNANPAYREMRKIRLNLRSQNKNLCGVKLMDGLYYYSELHNNYIRKIQEHIQKHDLMRFDDAQLNHFQRNS